MALSTTGWFEHYTTNLDFIRKNLYTTTNTSVLTTNNSSSTNFDSRIWQNKEINMFPLKASGLPLLQRLNKDFNEWCGDIHSEIFS